ncbi:DUF1738 domain-containing protein [Tamlana sp. s12]|uniref:zincin-like metallopeptidase domain-containing protein n=1 Tax=Tamlana sp. s12 TaxID=1630406 RepID=UPI00080238AE|nr:zincin-like metallopeptidase domain-containing protein [Tamlana sp. s12]OBQ52883.1 hypothetical protein VQ01_13120 [Tamlana sp. s12]QQY81090.1 DUF1738 domain-containing protein [Tamlana sp. s12]
MKTAYNKIVTEYNGLAGKQISRHDLMTFAERAELEHAEHVANKLRALLAAYPNEQGFDFTKVKTVEYYESFSALGIPFISPDQEKQFGLTEAEGLGKRISNEDIYKMITNKFIKIIDESGELPWSAGFNKAKDTSFTFANLPMNYQSEKYYRGINALVLSMYRYHTDETRGKVYINSNGEFEEGITEVITDNRLFWLTFKQIKEEKGKVKKGSLSQQAIYYNFVYTYKGKTISEKRYKQLKNQLGQDDKDLRKIGFLKYYNVFNERDIENIDFDAKRAKLKLKEKDIKSTEKKILAADLVLKHMPNKPNFETRHLDQKTKESPHYNPNSDTVVMPLKSQFDAVESWYGIAFHEFIHATGHASRTNRRNIAGFERGANKYDGQYALEELVAEIGAIFLNAESGIMLANLKNNASYIKGWAKGVKKELQDNHKAIFKAAAQSQKAADYILNFDENGDPAYWKEFDEISKEIKAKGAAKKKKKELLIEKLIDPKKLTNIQLKQISKEYANDILWSDKIQTYIEKIRAEHTKRKTPEKTLFVLNDLPKKFEKQIFSNPTQQLNRLTSFTDKTLSNAAKNMLDLVENRHFTLLHFNNGYIRDEKKPVYVNVPVYIYEKIYKTTTDRLSKDQLTFMLSRLEDYQYNTAWNEYNFNGKDVFQINKIVKYNISTLKRFLNPEPPKPKKQTTDTSTKKVVLPKPKSKSGQLALFGLKKSKTTNIKYDRKAMEALKKAHGVSFDFIRKAINGVRKSTTALHLKKEYNDIVNGNKTHALNGIIEPETIEVVTPIIIEVEKPVATIIETPQPQSNPLVTKINHEVQSNGSFIIGGDLGKFLGDIEVKPVGSVACTIDAEQGAGKTRFLFQLANEMAKNYKVLFISLEEHPQSTLFQDKVKQYIEPQNMNNIDTVGELDKGKEKQLLDSLIPNYDVILIDSWNKIFEAAKLDFDNDLRKAYNGKLIFSIFQRTVTGSMRGGAKAGFDGDIIMKGLKGEDFKDNVIVHNKNRYQSNDLTKLKFNVYDQGLVQMDDAPISETLEETPIKKEFLEWEDATVILK